MLTRDQMVAIIQRGESVMIGTEVYDSVDRLPSEAQLAQGDPQREGVALANLDAQMAALAAQKELILNAQLARQGAPPGEPPGEQARQGVPQPAHPTQAQNPGQQYQQPTQPAAPAPPAPEGREEQVLRREVGVPRRAK
jgi:hypothetical protein